MKTEEDINAKILKITMVIQENYPELAEYLNEMPITIPNQSHPEMTVKNLEKYYDNLVNLFRKYVSEQQLNYTNQHKNLGL